MIRIVCSGKRAFKSILPYQTIRSSTRNIASTLQSNQCDLPDKHATLAKFSFPLATHTIKSVYSNKDSFINDRSKLVTLNGHLHKKPRIMAARSFAELRDSNGDIIQILMTPEDTAKRLYELLEAGGAEDSVSVTGYIQTKHTQSDKQDNIELELVAVNYQLLNSSNLDAARLDKLKHSNPHDLPPQFRYLQLRTPFYQKSLKTRSKASNTIRNVLINNHNFTEIETPLLFKSTPEGAREFLVPTRSPDKFYALPQSPQQYKQILMSSGFTRYFQIAKCFRDEDLRADRQPEFTQVDLEMSYISNSDQVGIVIEDIIHNVWNKVGETPTYKVNEKGYLEQIDFDTYDNSKLLFEKLSYKDALKNYGIDKPDLRSALKFTDLSSFFSPKKNQANFPVLESCVLRGAFDPSEKYKIPKILTDANNYSRRNPIVIAIKTTEDAQKWYKKFIEKEVLIPSEKFNAEELNSTLNLQPGDVIAFSTRAELTYENPTPLGRFRQLAISQFPNKWNRPMVDKTSGELITDYDISKVFVGSWVVDFPLFNPVEIGENATDEFPTYAYDKFESTHHPFTMAKLDDYDMLINDPLKVRGEHYDLVINGVEVGGGSRRIHDSELQTFIFERILKISNYQKLFGHLLHALSMGCPPHAGIALGFDRLCAMLIGSKSIRDVIAFPKNQSGVDPVVESPTDIPEKTLNEYYITKREK